MNNSIQGSFEYDLLERCSKGEVNYSNKNFRKHLTSKGVLQSQCKPCRNRNQKEYQLKSREKINNCSRQNFQQNKKKTLRKQKTDFIQNEISD